MPIVMPIVIAFRGSKIVFTLAYAHYDGKTKTEKQP